MPYRAKKALLRGLFEVEMADFFKAKQSKDRGITSRIDRHWFFRRTTLLDLWNCDVNVSSKLKSPCSFLFLLKSHDITNIVHLSLCPAFNGAYLCSMNTAGRSRGVKKDPKKHSYWLPPSKGQGCIKKTNIWQSCLKVCHSKPPPHSWRNSKQLI